MVFVEVMACFSWMPNGIYLSAGLSARGKGCLDLSGKPSLRLHKARKFMTLTARRPRDPSDSTKFHRVASSIAVDNVAAPA